MHSCIYDQLRIGESKFQARIDEGTHNPEGIFSYSTKNSYLKVIDGFCEYLAEKGINKYEKLENTKKYVPDYLNYLIGKGLSASTIRLVASGLAKVFKCSSTDFGVDFPERKRADIKRGRNLDTTKFDEKYKDLSDFCRGCGLRRKELSLLKGKDVTVDSDGNVSIFVEKGKGGKSRTVSVLPEYAEAVIKLTKDIAEDEKVFKKFPRDFEPHHYRGCFAQTMYQKLARRIADIPNKHEIYIMRKDRAGEKFDKEAMLKVSRQLGHERISVIAGNYLYNMKGE